MLTVLLSRNDERITDTLLATINPIKQSYKNFTQNIEDKSHSYIFQKESIEKLSRENRILRKRILEQMHYIEEVKNIYKVLPDLNRLPVSAISIVETISYVKLNSFSQVILTKPKGLTENKLYGIIQGNVVAGTAHVHRNQLYGYLTSDKKCQFSVFIGRSKAPGIAFGHKTKQMVVKFIPKWHNVQVGEKVYTSGLDNIFFSDIPVGIVTKVEIQSSYTVAYIKTYSDIFHPKAFFLINNAKATLLEEFDSNRTLIMPIHTNERDTSISVTVFDLNETIPTVSSIPSRIDQTQEELIEPEIEEEHMVVKKQRKKILKRKRKISTFDLF
jgi:rod shape-determining protein MreC